MRVVELGWSKSEDVAESQVTIYGAWYDPDPPHYSKISDDVMCAILFDE